MQSNQAPTLFSAVGSTNRETTSKNYITSSDLAETAIEPIKKKWQDYKVTAHEEIDEGEPMLSIGDYTILSRGNLITVLGKPKCYKTFFISAIGGALSKGEYMGITCGIKKPKLLLIDTEQGRARTQNVLRRINKIGGYDPETGSEDIVVASVRELNSDERLRIIKDAVDEFKPDFVLIDGIRDLLTNFNDINESCNLVGELMRLSEVYCCGIVTVIHQNKADTNARGHLGSELMNKSETVIELKKEANGVAEVLPLFCRNPEFKKFAFRINDEGLPELCTLSARNNNPKDEIRSTITQAMRGTATIDRKQLIANLTDINGFSGKTAERRISDALDYEVLAEAPNKSYTLLPDTIEEVEF